MGNRKDLSGMIYGDFTIIEPDTNVKKYEYRWICKCNNCGAIKSKTYNNLKHSNNRCECNEKFGVGEYKGYIEDLTGKVFDKLTVIEYAGKIDTHSAWKCKCECGNYTVRSCNILKRQKHLACEKCMQKTKKIIVEKIKKQNIIEYQDTYAIINNRIFVDIEDVEKILSYDRYISVNNEGYAYFKYKQEEIFLHRLLVGLPNRYDPETKLISDHENGNRLDDRKSNLRIITKELNPINCKVYKNNTSGCKGVSWLERLQKWQVNINVNKKSIYLGVYEDYDTAVKVRKEAEEKYFGEYNRKDA